jgi:hypothetical protein
VSVKVDLAGLEDRIAEFGPAAYLVTVGEDGCPHVVSVAVTVAPGPSPVLSATAGRSTRANLAARPALTLLWPAASGGAYSLVVDGVAQAGADADGGPIVVAPASAVLHRVADAAGEGPTCLPVSQPAP